MVDVRVDVGRCVVAEGRACWGRVKHVAFPKTNQNTKIASREIQCGESCVNIYVYFLLVTLPNGCVGVVDEVGRAIIKFNKTKQLKSLLFIFLK